MDASTETSDALYAAAWKLRCSVHDRLCITLRYHRKRQRFFDLADKLTKAATVLLGASLLGTALKEEQPMIASAISALGLLALVFGYGDRKQVHKELAEAAALQIAKIEESPVDKLDDALARGWEADLSRLNMKEPPALSALVQICEWEQARLRGSGHVKRPWFGRRLFADFF